MTSVNIATQPQTVTMRLGAQTVSVSMPGAIAASQAAASAIDAEASADAAAASASAASSSANAAATYSDQLAALAAINYYVDASAGSDSNDGLTEATAFATIEKARSVMSAGDTIGVKRGQTHYRTGTGSLLGSLVGYGTSPQPAVVSAGQSLAGKTWTVHSGTVYKTTITLAEAHTVGGSGFNTNTTYPFVRLGDDYYEWAVNNGSIAANLTALASMEGGFAINVTGDTSEDIRTGAPSSTSFDLYVRMPGGADPNGKALHTLNYPSTYTFTADLIQDIEFRDWWGKDGQGTNSGAQAPRLRRVRSIGGGCHGWVGPSECWGFYAKGIARKGMDGATEGVAAGGGWNGYVTSDRSGLVLRHRGIEIDGFGNAIYAHEGAGTNKVAERYEFHPAVDDGWESLKIRNTRAAFQFDVTFSGNKIFGDGVHVHCPVDVIVRRVFALSESTFRALGGGTVNFETTASNRHSIFQGQGPAINMKAVGLTITSDLQNSVSFFKNLYYTLNAYSVTPEYEFKNCTIGGTNADDHFFVDNNATAAGGNLTLSIGTVTGDVIPNGGANYPDDVTITHDVTFAFADQTSRANVRSLLNGAGKTHSIDNDTTLNRLNGTLAEAPA